MNAYLLRKKIFTVLFLVFIFGYSMVNAWHGYGEWKNAVLEPSEENKVSEMIGRLDGSITESMYERMKFIEIYSFLQVLLDKREINNFDIIRDEDGYLHYASFFREEPTKLKEYARRVKRMQDFVEERGTKVLFCVAPSKYMYGENNLRKGLQASNPDDIVNELLFHLNRYGVETLDYRKYIPNETMSLQEAFFRTDHHWTIPAAFEATKILVETMEEKFGVRLDPKGYYLDDAQYERVVYPSCMLGSMGRRSGANFSKIEDYEALWPRFDISYKREYENVGGIRGHKKGTAQEALMDAEILTKGSNIYRDSVYSMYLNGVRPYEKIINMDNPDGCSLFAIRDSYFSPMMVFLAPMFGRMEAMWSLEESGQLDIETYVRNNEFDYIIVEIYPYNINEDAFRFFEEDER